jgi:serine/threonine-protein kinase
MAEDVFGIVGTVQGGAFRVDEVVAEGGFAVVYRAYHAAFRSSVALKCLKVPRALSEREQAEFLEKFREEAELLFRLSSAIPSVVRPLHVATLEGAVGRFVPYLALEWLDGQTLDELVTSRALAGQLALELRAAVKLLTPVADALCRAHRFPSGDGYVSIIHRDLKPENIFIAKVHGREVTKVLDFGIAKVKSAATQIAGRQSATESPLAAFTPAYGAPEQWLPKRYGQTGPWTDVWGLALTLVEVVSGHTPIDGDQAAMLGSVIDPARRPTPRNEGVRVPDAIEALFTRALAVDPRDRFADVASFWNPLCRFLGLPELGGEGSRSLPPPAPARPPPEPAPRSRAQDSVKTERAPLSAAALPGIGLAPTASTSIGRPVAPAARGRPRRSLRAGRRLELAGPLKLLGIAVLLMAVDFAYSTYAGEALRLGPARMFWLAGPIAVLGVVRLFSSLLEAAD